MKSSSLKNNTVKITKAILVAVVMIATVGCVAKVIATKQYSGFLKDYSGLEEVKFSDGRSSMRWASSGLTKGKYANLYIEPIAVYPEPKSGQQLNPKLMEESARYLGLKVRHQLRGGNVKVVEKQTADTIRVRAAITTVETRLGGKDKAKGFEPMTVLVGGSDAVAEKRKRDVDVYLEVELTDMKTGEVLARSVKKGVSNKTVQNAGQALTFEDVRPVLDLWAADAQRFAEKMMARK